MKHEQVVVKLFEKGDRVRTAEGVGTVAEDEEFYYDDPVVNVVLDKPTSRNPREGDVIEFDRILVSSLDENENRFESS